MKKQRYLYADSALINRLNENHRKRTDQGKHVSLVMDKKNIFCFVLPLILTACIAAPKPRKQVVSETEYQIDFEYKIVPNPCDLSWFTCIYEPTKKAALRKVHPNKGT